MEFRLLGPLEVVDGERRLNLGPRKQRAVLAILAIDANRAVSVDKLIDALWGEHAPTQALGTLHAYVSNLRRVLEPHRTTGAPPSVLVTQRPGYRLAVDSSHMDTAQFEAKAADGRRLLDQGCFTAARTRLAEGLALWRGAALADFSFEAFAHAEAARLEECRLEVTEDWLRAGLDLGDLRVVVSEAEVLVGEHPLRERLWGLLMLGLYRCGRQADALRTYQKARGLLAEELGIEPSPSLRRLEAEILAQAASLDWRPPPAILGVDVGSSPHGPGPPVGGPLTFVGRQRELARMEMAMGRAMQGRGAVLLVSGEPGIGKTRLARELVARSGVQGLATAWGGSAEGGASPAYWPWVSIVRSLLKAGDAEDLREAMGAGAGDLALVVPEVKEVARALEAASMVDPDTARMRLFETVLRLLRCVARQRPLVVILDDLQWADPASLQLLGYVGSALQGLPILVVGTYRPAEVGPRDPLADTLVTLARHEAVERIELSGLNGDEVRGLIVAATGRPAADSLVAGVHARTGGNPFFVAELARLLSDEQVEAETVGRMVPAGVRDVVRRQLARLSEDTNALLGLAAVAGLEFDLPLLEATASCEPERALELVETALLMGVVLEQPDAVGRFRFSHDLVRETILEGLTATRRAYLHLRLAGAIEALHGGDDRHAVALAHHLFAAARVTDAARPVDAALRAAEIASARLAHEQAEDQLRRARTLVGDLTPSTERDRRELEIILRLSSVLTITKGYADPEIGEVLERARVRAPRARMTTCGRSLD